LKIIWRISQIFNESRKYLTNVKNTQILKIFDKFWQNLVNYKNHQNWKFPRSTSFWESLKLKLNKKLLYPSSKCLDYNKKYPQNRWRHKKSPEWLKTRLIFHTHKIKGENFNTKKFAMLPKITKIQQRENGKFIGKNPSSNFPKM
jgi:hypothetical protein